MLGLAIVKSLKRFNINIIYQISYRNCTEAEYAFNTRKRIVAVRLQADYMPDGWLGQLCRSNLFYDFSAPEKFNDEWSKLHAKLKELKDLKQSG